MTDDGVKRETHVEIDELGGKHEKLEKRVERYLKEEEHDHDELVRLRLRVDELENRWHGILNRRTWFGRLFFRGPPDEHDD